MLLTMEARKWSIAKRLSKNINGSGKQAITGIFGKKGAVLFADWKTGARGAPAKNNGGSPHLASSR